MSTLPMFPRTLLLIVMASVLLRLVSAMYQGPSLRPLPGVTDQVSYHQLAIRVADGHGFSFATGWWPATRANQPTAHWSFLYVLFLSGLYWLAGPAVLVARIVQAVIVGILHPLLAWRIGSRLFGVWAGLGAAAFTATYGYFVFYAGALVTESLYILGFLWALDLATVLACARGAEQRGFRLWALLGIACGVTALLRQAFLLVVPVLVLWTVWMVWRRSGGTLAATASRAAVAVLAMVLCILPWTIRNYQAFDRFVLLNTNAGFVFFWANHPVHGTDFIPIIPAGEVNYQTLLPQRYEHLNEAELDRALLRDALGFVAADPGRYVRLSLSRAEEYFKFWPSETSALASNLVRVLSFGLLLPLSVAGVVLALSRRRARQTDRAGVLLLLAVAAVYSAVHLLTWTLVRYRLPVDAVLMPFAGLAIAAAASRLRAALPARRAVASAPIV